MSDNDIVSYFVSVLFCHFGNTLSGWCINYQIPETLPKCVSNILKVLKYVTIFHAISNTSLSDNDIVDLRTLLTNYYDIKSVRAELLCEIKDHVDEKLAARLCAILDNGVRYSFLCYYHDYIYSMFICICICMYVLGFKI